MRERRQKLPAQRLFFPAAALHAALLMPLSMASLLGGWTWPPGLSHGHGREMLFGFALALICGYLLGPQPRWRLYGIFGLWLGARLSALFMPDGVLAGLFNLAFALTAAWLIVPKLTAAKTWRNRSIAPLVLVLLLFPVGYWFAIDWQWLGANSLFLFAIILLSLLMLFMGGRLITASVGGEIQRRGGRLTARVQPNLEAALIVLMSSAAILTVAPVSKWIVGIALVSAGLVAAIRMARWRLWECLRADLLALGAGYFWLVLGQIVLGWALWNSSVYSGVWHIITIGALGTLSITIAARVYLVKLKQADAVAPFFVVTPVLIGLTTLLRMMADYLPDHTMAWLWLATACWSMAYLLLAMLLLGLLTGDKCSQDNQ